MKSKITMLLLLFCANTFAQMENFAPKGAKKIRVETTNYYQSDTNKATEVLYFDKNGNLTKSIKYDDANEQVEIWTHSYKYKGGKLKSRESKFQDYKKVLKKQKLKFAYFFNDAGKLLKVENTSKGSGYEMSYDSVGNPSGKSDYNEKGFYGGAKYYYKDGKIVKQSYQQSGKPAEVTEYSYDSQGRRIKALIYKGNKLIRKEDYVYVE